MIENFFLLKKEKEKIHLAHDITRTSRSFVSDLKIINNRFHKLILIKLDKKK